MTTTGTDANPFTFQSSRPKIDGDITAEELGLANRNHGMALEALRYDVTPAGMHYLLIHFDIPFLDANSHRLSISGAVENPTSLSIEDIRALPQVTRRVTMECAGNGRARMTPRHPSMPWALEAVGTAEWTGAPLRHVLEQAGIKENAQDVVFFGADRGSDVGIEHDYGRALKPNHALQDDVLLVTAMNGAPLLPQHGFPLRLIVPGWYGMTNVKWLERIEVWDRPFDGPQQTPGYHFRQSADEIGTPVSTMRVKSLMVPPGIPDWFTRQRQVNVGRIALEGRAWSGAGVAIERVEIGIDGVWQDAQLRAADTSTFAWRGWNFDWDATPGEHEIACRATDANGNVQPSDAVWDYTGLGNNAVQRVKVWVR